MIEILDIISSKMRLNRYIFSLRLLHKWLFRLNFILSGPAARRQEQNDQNEAQGGKKKRGQIDEANSERKIYNSC